MPIKKISYTCQFRCGERAKPLAKMKQHESKCWKNPSVKTCFTCKNATLYTERPDSEYGEFGMNHIECKSKKISKYLGSDEYFDCKGHTTDNYKLIEPIKECPCYSLEQLDYITFKINIINPIRLKWIKEERKIREVELDNIKRGIVSPF